MSKHERHQDLARQLQRLPSGVSEWLKDGAPIPDDETVQRPIRIDAASKDKMEPRGCPAPGACACDSGPRDAELRRAAKAVLAHWDEFGPEYGLDEVMDWLRRTLKSTEPEPEL